MTHFLRPNILGIYWVMCVAVALPSLAQENVPEDFVESSTAPAEDEAAPVQKEAAPAPCPNSPPGMGFAHFFHANSSLGWELKLQPSFHYIYI